MVEAWWMVLHCTALPTQHKERGMGGGREGCQTLIDKEEKEKESLCVTQRLRVGDQTVKE